MTVGGDQIDYPGKVTTRTVDLTTTKIHLNSVVSTPDSIFAVLDIGSFYLNTPLERPEYARIAAKYLPDTVMEKYNLRPITSDNGYIYMEINKGMYGLPQARQLANDLLRKSLAPHGFYECTHTPGYWRHKSRNTKFCLWVNDFGVG